MFKLIKTYKNTINNLQKELRQQKQRNDSLQHDCMILLETNREQRHKMQDYENNIEFLVNNLSAKKRELVRPHIKTNSK